MNIRNTTRVQVDTGTHINSFILCRINASAFCGQMCVFEDYPVEK